MEILVAVVVLMWTGGALVVVGVCNAAARGDRAPAAHSRPARTFRRRR